MNQPAAVPQLTFRAVVLAIVLAGNGKRDEARGAFEKVVQADSDGDLARLARQNLEGL